MAKGFEAHVGNEALLVSDSKRPYQLASPHSLSPYLLYFLSAATLGLQAALWEKYLFYIHHFYSASVFITKQVLSSLIHCWFWLSLNKLQHCRCMER